MFYLFKCDVYSCHFHLLKIFLITTHPPPNRYHPANVYAGVLTSTPHVLFSVPSTDHIFSWRAKGFFRLQKWSARRRKQAISNLRQKAQPRREKARRRIVV